MHAKRQLHTIPVKRWNSLRLRQIVHLISDQILKCFLVFNLASQLQQCMHVKPWNKVTSPFFSGLSCFFPLFNIISTETERQKRIMESRESMGKRPFKPAFILHTIFIYIWYVQRDRRMMLHLPLFSLQCTPLYGQKYWAVYTLNLQELLMLMSEEELCSYWISRALDLHGISCHPLCSMLDVQSGHRWPFFNSCQFKTWTLASSKEWPLCFRCRSTAKFVLLRWLLYVVRFMMWQFGFSNVDVWALLAALHSNTLCCLVLNQCSSEGVAGS